MSAPAYKGASQQIGLWFLFSIGTVVAFLTVIMASIHFRLEDVMGEWTFAPAGITLVGGVILAWRVTSRLNRQRIQRVANRLERDGFLFKKEPTEAQRNDFAGALAHLLPSLGLTYGANGIQWFAVREDGGARIFEHRYTTGSGKTLVEHFHTVIAWPAGHPALDNSGLATAPWLFLAQYNRFLRREARKRELQAPEFADVAVRWSLIGDAATATRFLKPGVRAQLERSPKQETWCMGAGYVCCMYKGVFDAPHLEQFLSHSRSILDAAVH